MERYFNFNNEQVITPIDVDTVTGEVTFELDGESTTFESVHEFAESYADARNVRPENLENWTLVEDGDTLMLYYLKIADVSRVLPDVDMAQLDFDGLDTGLELEQ